MLGANTDRMVSFLENLRVEDVPIEVVNRSKDLMLDWLGSVLAGRGARPTQVMQLWAEEMGPQNGRSECLTNGQSTTPVFAALVNGAASHVVEQDDVHNGSVVHAGATVIPAALACAQDRGSSGAELMLAIVCGYEAAIRVGRFLGQTHYKIFHTSGTAGTIGAAIAVAKLLRLGGEAFRDALGSSGTQAAGLWEFLRDAADSKQLHVAKAGADGLLAAYGAKWGLKGAQQILEGPQGMGAGFSRDTRPDALSEFLGERWAVMETSLKWHASCRHTHPAADALDQVMRDNHLKWEEIISVQARVHRAAIDVLGPASAALTTHQSKFSMPFVLSLIAIKGHASITDFTEDSLNDPQIREFMRRVTMVEEPNVESAYPERWIGNVEVVMGDGRTYHGQIDIPRGDPGNFLSRDVIREKIFRLAEFGGFANKTVLQRAMSLIEDMDTLVVVPHLLSQHD